MTEAGQEIEDNRDFERIADAIDYQSPSEKDLLVACRKIALATGQVEKLKALRAGAASLSIPVRHGMIHKQDVVDRLLDQAMSCGLLADVGEDVVTLGILEGLEDFEPVHAQTNGHHAEPPPPAGPEDYGVHGAQCEQGEAAPIDFRHIPLTMEQWLDRDLPAPDLIMGEWLTTTSRVLLNAPTGLGKTNFAMALGAHIAEGKDFLHWRGHRPTRVLFVDGEMSRRLLRRRAEDIVRRMGLKPAGLFLVSHEDVPNFQPLNTPAGMATIKAVIQQLGGVDLVVFDNIMCLIAGDQKDEEGWQQAQPLVNALTRAAVGQLWIHHTGHDSTHGYGTKTREWKVDTVVHLTEAKRADTDVSFTLEFHKARERTPETRRDFESVTIALVNDEWQGSVAAEKHGKPAPLEAKFLEALQDTFSAGETTLFQTWQAIKVDRWRAECARRGLIDTAKPDSARTLFSKYKRELIAHNLIACNDDLVWLR
jgi:hypothetical protein